MSLMSIIIPLFIGANSILNTFDCKSTQNSYYCGFRDMWQTLIIKVIIENNNDIGSFGNIDPDPLGQGIQLRAFCKFSQFFYNTKMTILIVLF